MENFFFRSVDRERHLRGKIRTFKGNDWPPKRQEVSSNGSINVLLPTATETFHEIVFMVMKTKAENQKSFEANYLPDQQARRRTTPR